MNLSKSMTVFGMILVVGLTGCINPSVPVVPSNEMLLPDKNILSDDKEMFAVSYHYLQRANESETLNDWYMALYFCRIAYQLDPDNKDIESKIVMLAEKVKTESEMHFQSGIDFYQANETENARNQFLSALRINPDHQKAMEYLMDIIQEPEKRKFHVNEKKALDIIAQEVYEDSEKSFLIAYFNDLPDKSVPEIGSTLIIPPVEINKQTDAFDLEKDLMMARSYLESRHFSRALDMISKILKHQSDHPEALQLEQEVYLQIAREFEKFGKYTDALNALTNIKMSCQSTQNYVAHLRQLVKNRADIYYRRGVRFFVNEELEKAILEWKKALAIDPVNTTIQKDIENAENILEKLHQIQ
ncbi:MAG: hypothetical protein R6U27_07955 [Desulfobacterales bacterium]